MRLDSDKLEGEEKHNISLGLWSGNRIKSSYGANCLSVPPTKGITTVYPKNNNDSLSVTQCILHRKNTKTKVLHVFLLNKALASNVLQQTHSDTVDADEYSVVMNAVVNWSVGQCKGTQALRLQRDPCKENPFRPSKHGKRYSHIASGLNGLTRKHPEENWCLENVN